MSAQLDQRVIAELKGLVMDATRKANSGHPGGAFSSADFAVILFRDYLRFAPQMPEWHNRDRFILSAGHESMLLYSLLHFMDLLPIEELENFRQLGSLTPGHPENHLTPGVEATTGPLGQGVSMAVGMAIGSLHQQAMLGSDLINNTIYSLVGDGDLQEDVALGSMQIAGHLGLSNLVVYYDKNDIQI
jgi:transketolase